MNGVTLVTGATGFIGRYLIRMLLAEDRPSRVLVRDPARLDPMLRDRVHIVQGDMRDALSVRAAMRGADTVLHLAALARAWCRDPTGFHTANVDAVERLLEAARRESVSRFVHVSTIVTLAPHRPAPGADRCTVHTPYQETKLAGERLVEAYADSGRHAVIVHPTRVYGPGPLTDANGVSRLIAMYLNGRLRIRLADAGVLANWVHAEDVAAGILLASRRAHRGAHYVLGGPENVSFGDLLGLVEELSGVHRHLLTLQPRTAVAVGRLAELWGHLGGSVSLTRGWVRTFLEDHRVDIAPARRDLGYDPRPLRRGVGETIAWLRREGFVGKRGARVRSWFATPDPRAS
jgi:farnesol dehydrogenase